MWSSVPGNGIACMRRPPSPASTPALGLVLQQQELLPRATRRSRKCRTRAGRAGLACCFDGYAAADREWGRDCLVGRVVGGHALEEVQGYAADQRAVASR
jgi:hypothetical protein